MKNIKRVLFGLFLSVLFITSTNASTVTIKETTDSADNYNTIADGTIVIGITKFDSEYDITATEVVTASYNDFVFNLEADKSYEKPKIYVYAGENWYELDKSNMPQPVEEDTQEELSTNNDIFYVNNDEKVLEVPFNNSITASADYTLEVTTDKTNKTATIENGVLKVPATVKKVEVAAVKKVDDNVEDRVVIESIEKKNSDDSSTTFEAITNEDGEKVDFTGSKITSYVGTISKVDTIGGTYTAKVDGSNVTISGTVLASRANAVSNLKAGNLVAFTITAPEMDGYESIKVGESANAFDANGTYVWYVYLDKNTTSNELTVTWVDGVNQKFVINSESAELEALPAGTIEGVTLENVEYAVNGNDITVKGNLEWVKASEDKEAGNYAAVKITAPKDFTVAKSIVIDEKDSSWGSANTFVYYPKFTSNTDTHTIIVTWEDGNVQTFNIKLAEDATLQDPYKGSVKGYADFNKNITYTVDNTTLVVGGKLAWEDSTTRKLAGNYAAIKFIAPSDYTNTELENANIKINDGDADKWNNDVYYFRFDEVKEYTVVITWQAGNAQTFTIKLAEDAVLGAAPAATVEGENDYNGKVTYAVDNNTVTIGGTLEYASAQNGRKAGNYATLKVTAPTYYNDLSNVTVKIDNDTYTWNDVMANGTVDNDDANAFVYYPRFTSNDDTHTITITWENGNVQVINIKLAEDATLEPVPAATVEGENDYNGKVTYAVENNTVTIGGTLEYALADETLQNGREAGNYAAVKVTAPTYYKDLSKVTVKIDEKTYTWNEVMEYENAANKAANAFVYYPRFTSNDDTHTITITWEEENVQVITIKLAEDATLERLINVGNTEDFQAALNDANVEKVVVANSFDLSDSISINANRKITVDFGGNTITAPESLGNKKIINVTKESNNGDVTFTNGTLKVDTESTYGAIRVGDLGTDAENEIDLNETKVTLDESFKVESKFYGLVVRGSNFTVNVNGEITVEDSYAISGGYNSRYKQNITININETAKITSNEIAIYMPSYMIVNINGGEITGKSVVGIKLGELNISGGTLTATGTKIEDKNLKKTGNGIDITGDVIYAEINDIYYTHYQTNNNKTNEQVLKINITGGTLKSENANIIRELNLTDNNLVYDVDLTRVFSADKTEVSTYNDVEANLTVNGVKYTTKDMQRAMDVSGDNVEMVLLTDIDLSQLLIFG